MPDAIDRSSVEWEAYPGAANDLETDVQARGGWRCELHPDREWPHDDCPGPGIAADEAERMLADIRELREELRR